VCVCFRLAASFGSYKIGATATALCCRHKQTDGRTDRHLQNIDSARNFHTFRDTEEVGETKMFFCVYYGQSNYPKAILTTNLAAIKEHFTNFCCFQKEFSDAPHFGCNSAPRQSVRAVTYTQRGHTRMMLLQDPREEMRPATQRTIFLPSFCPSSHVHSVPFVIITVSHSSQRQPSMGA